MNYLNDIDALVLGLGESGLAMARWCARHGARVRVWDSRENAPQDAALAEALPQAQRLRGELTDEAFAGVKLVLKSPGLAPTDQRIARPLARAADTGILVQGELELFARALADLKEAQGYAPKLLAITGTNGKTTTTAMTALLVERAGKRVAMAGNIGPTMLQTLADALDAAAREDEPQPLPEVWVLELSSFQLDEAKGFEPDAATVLNISEDHLDWHGSMAAYVAAKARIFGKDAVMVINRDDAAVEKMVPEPIPVRAAVPSRSGATCCASASASRPGRATSACAPRTAWPVGAGDGSRRDDEAPQGRRRGGAAHPAPDARRCAARARPPQRRQCAGRTGAGHRHRLPARTDAARPARIRRRAASRGIRGHRQRRRRLRRQQGHERGRDRGRARRPGRRQGAGEAGGHPRRRRQGTGLHAAARAGRAPCTRRGHHRPRCAAHRGSAGRPRAAAAAPRDAASRGALVLRACPRG
ncbi:hypothetical protein FSC37_02670 [Piscinibacter aquaticus]|uniref:Mur ligase central domain-containing protein n=1 Tax=Piscinibacter aquaticus TaxID=392597 RepID=A0A5C6TY33_9BURK|nr:hypothetical protein FSC37_02670 [Piscinibacter aquaticus]